MAIEKDIQLIERIKSGTDPTADKEFISWFFPRIERKVWIQLEADKQDCEDLINEIILSVLVAIRQGKFSAKKGKSLGLYVYGIAHNKIKDYMKSKKIINRTYTDLDPDTISGLTKEFDLDKRELHKKLRNHLSSLSLELQEILYLRFYDGLKVREISKKINIPPRKISEKIQYALRLLRKNF